MYETKKVAIKKNPQTLSFVVREKAIKKLASKRLIALFLIHLSGSQMNEMYLFI
jgi:hypothetical protein